MITVLGWIFLVFIAIWIISHIVLYFVNLFKVDKYRGLTIDTYCWWSSFDDWVIIPTIETSVTNYLNITFRWLELYYSISIHPVTETEDELYTNYKAEQKKKEQK